MTQTEQDAVFTKETIKDPNAAETAAIQSEQDSEDNKKHRMFLGYIPMELPKPDGQLVPEWFKLPPEMPFPRGKQVIFVRFRAPLTDTPWKGERQCCVWSNSIGDEKLALMRANGDANRIEEQLTKQMVRVIDGNRSDWTGEAGAANIDVWWDEIGPKCRNVLNKLFVQLHIASKEEAKDFFENCVVVRGVTG